MNKIFKKFTLYLLGAFILITIVIFALPRLIGSSSKDGLIIGIIAFVALVSFVVPFTIKKITSNFMTKFSSCDFKGFPFGNFKGFPFGDSKDSPFGDFKGFPFGGKVATTPDIPNGIVTGATITNFQQSGVNMSMGTLQYYEMLIDLNVEGIDDTVWPARIKQLIPLAQLNMFQIGSRISVKYDPNDKSKVNLTTEKPDHGGGGSNMDIPGYGTVNSQTTRDGMQTAPRDITLRVQASQALFLELSVTGIAASAAVLSSHLLYENYRNGSDIYLLKLMVNATEIPPFEAEIIGVMAKSALPKIAPNKTVYVKYDRNNPLRISMTGTDKLDNAILR